MTPRECWQRAAPTGQPCTAAFPPRPRISLPLMTPSPPAPALQLRRRLRCPVPGRCHLRDGESRCEHGASTPSRMAPVRAGCSVAGW